MRIYPKWNDEHLVKISTHPSAIHYTWKINMEPENTGPLEEEHNLPNHHFQVRNVNLRACAIKICSAAKFLMPQVSWIDLLMSTKSDTTCWKRGRWWLAISCSGGDFSDILPSSKSPEIQLSHERNPLTFHYTGWLIGILIMVYDNPYIIG